MLIKKYQNEQKSLLAYKGIETKINDKKINLYANIGSILELDIAIENDAEGIGLFRTEFQYLDRTNLPTVNDLFSDYKLAVQKMKGKKVILRTLDIGADKNIEYLFKNGILKNEENPSLGIRGIRVGLENPKLITEQLRAMLLASKFGKVAIMFPMVASVWEVKTIRKIIDKEINNIVKKDSTYNIDKLKNIEIGINVETPASVMMAKKNQQIC